MCYVFGEEDHRFPKDIEGSKCWCGKVKLHRLWLKIPDYEKETRGVYERKSNGDRKSDCEDGTIEEVIYFLEDIDIDSDVAL